MVLMPKSDHLVDEVLGVLNRHLSVSTPEEAQQLRGALIVSLKMEQHRANDAGALNPSAYKEVCYEDMLQL